MTIIQARTSLTGNLLSTAEKEKAAADRHPLKRIGKPQDIASLAAYPLEPSGWISGQIISVEGRLSSMKPL